MRMAAATIAHATGDHDVVIIGSEADAATARRCGLEPAARVGAPSAVPVSNGGLRRAVRDTGHRHDRVHCVVTLQRGRRGAGRCPAVAGEATIAAIGDHRLARRAAAAVLRFRPADLLATSVGCRDALIDLGLSARLAMGPPGAAPVGLPAAAAMRRALARGCRAGHPGRRGCSRTRRRWPMRGSL